jgi:hypothetical protein
MVCAAMVNFHPTGEAARRRCGALQKADPLGNSAGAIERGSKVLVITPYQLG